MAAGLSSVDLHTFTVLQNSSVDVLGVRLDVPEEISAAQWQFLSAGERQRAEEFVYSKHRSRYVVARAGLRQVLAKRLQISPRVVEIVHSERGKPKLSPTHRAAKIEFNISHSGNLALYAFMRGGHEVGVDVEFIREIPDADDLAERFFSIAETESLRALPVNKRLLAFLACWTRKEAFIKALGLGLSCPLNAFDVTIDSDAPASISWIEEQTGTAANWVIQPFFPQPGYIAAVAYRELESALLPADQPYNFRHKNVIYSIK